QVTGLWVTGTPTNPVIYVTSSDSRQGAGEGGGDSNLDTNSGILSKLSWNGSSWQKLDLVRGLPRSEENHATNGIFLDENTNMLYLAVGGFTNAGAPSNNFGYTQEYALSACILSIDLDVIEAMPTIENGNNDYKYDLPTVDDPTRPNTGPGGADQNDPFGGNDGLNQARLVEGGPVQVYSPGWRNAYDVIITQSGKMYSIDNGANQGWGGYPIGEGTPNVNNNPNDANDYLNNQNGMHYISGPGYYAGHPNPIRANPYGAFLFTHSGGSGVLRTSTSGPNPLPADWPPIDPGIGANPVEGDFRQSGVEDGALINYPQSTNGLCEYTASNFSGAMQGNILSVGFAGAIYRAALNAAGDAVTNGLEVLASGLANQPLDIVARGDDDSFPGTVWIADFADNKIIILEPSDYDGSGVPNCEGAYNSTDEDGDGFTNADEIDNGTNPCSASSKPSDRDGDFISDLNDPDDDNDGIPDVNDAFAIDPNNGLDTPPELYYELFNEEPGFGFFGLGFTGLMTNGSTDYLDQYDADAIIAGGTSGLLTVPTTSGDAIYNNQDNAFQFGVNVDATTCKFLYRGRIKSPGAALGTPGGNKSMGIFVGTGEQNNYVKVVITGGIKVVMENDGALTSTSFSVPQVLDVSTEFVDLYLIVDPGAGTVQPAYSINSGGSMTPLGGPLSMGATLLAATQATGTALAVGVISTHDGSSQIFPTWDNLELKPAPSTSQAMSIVDPPGADINASCHAPGSFQLTNQASEGQLLQKATIYLGTAVLPDLLFDPNGSVGDDVGKDFTVDSEGGTGFADYNFLNPRDGGYETVEIFFNDFQPGETFTFSVDVDPTSIKGSAAPGPGSSAHVSGLELTGSSVQLDFDDCAQQMGVLFPVPGSPDAVQNCIQQEQENAPHLQVIGQPNGNFMLPYEIREQTVLITNGKPWAEVSLLLLEGALYLNGPGYMVEDFEANTLVQVSEYTTTLDGYGTAQLPVTFTKANEDAGLNHLVAAVREGDCVGAISAPQVIQVAQPNCDIALINCGGPAYTDSAGRVFEADAYFSGGTAGSKTVGISGTIEDPLFQKYRSKVYGGASFTYAIPVPYSGNFSVKLYFAELFKTAAGQREFDVTIEGVQVLDNYDIFAEVGQFTAVVKTFQTTVTDGTLNIGFVSVSGHDSPTIAAIEVNTECELTPFPVELITFYAEALAEEVVLSWETVSETNNDFFTLERSRDTNHFEELAVIDGAGNSRDLRLYRYHDTAPLPGRAYYRLKQTDFDGQFTYSPVIAVTFGSVGIPGQPTQAQTRVYPNPSDGRLLHVAFSAYGAEVPVSVRMIDLTGRQLMLQQSTSDVYGNGLITLRPGQQLAPGIYLIQVSSAGRMVHVKWLVE
ncbi:MAG: T9SS C-terminal target domain-containing protein, partial [Bacteroidetes bacterium]